VKPRLDRLKKLLAVQEKLKALHQTRHAGFVAEASAAKEDASDLVDRFNADDSLSGLFPEVYHRRIGSALAREEANRELARTEAARIATATVRTNMVERSYREVRQKDDREKGDRERLDMIGQRRGEVGRDK
jgi:hypothetical protein